jgi:glycosyltransferase involved in cell wall biosynthesis
MSEKNLLVISNSFPNQENTFAGNIFVKEQVKSLSRYYDNIYVVSPVAHGMERLRSTKHHNYQFNNVQVFFPKYFNNPLFWSWGRSAWVNLETRAVESLIKRENLRFDLIHAHFTWPSGAVAVKLKRIYSSPVIITEHTSTTFQKAIEMQDEASIEAWREANQIIRVRHSDVSMFERVNIPLSKVASIPNGYNSTQFRPVDTQRCRAALDLPQNKKIILYVGNFYGEVKGHRYLVDAISIIVKQRKDVLCIIVGSGKLQVDIEKQIRSLGLEDFIYLPGKKAHDEIPIWMNACDIFVLPSLNEGNPTVMFEALGCGKPFVGTRVGGVPEIITSDDYGLLVEPANPKDLAEKMQIAMNREWGNEKILHYAKRYTWENIAKEIMTVYEKALE